MDITHYSTATDFQWQRLIQAFSLEEYYSSIKKCTLNHSSLEATMGVGQPECLNGDTIMPFTNSAKYVTYIIEALRILQRQGGYPKQKQIIFLLDLANTAVKNESSFNELNSTHALQQLILIVNPTKLDTEEEVKLIFFKLLNSVLLHQSGVKWMTQTNYWVDVYSLILQYQRTNNTKILDPGYSLLATLLEKAVEEDTQFCTEFIQFMANPIFLALQELRESRCTSMIVYTRQIYNNISPHGRCLAEVLELLLEHRTTKILKVFLRLKLREACDNIACISDDQDFIIIMYRVVIMLSFYEISETFDGIKVISHNPLDLSGFHRIVVRENEKCHTMVVLELCYYALKYFKNKGINLPKHQGKDKPIDIENEIMCFQAIPAVTIAEYLASRCCHWLPHPTDLQSFVKYRLGVEILSDCSLGVWIYGYALKETIFNGTLDNIIESFDVLLKSKAFYSMQSINRLILLLCYVLKDIYDYFKDAVKKRIISYEEQMLVQRFLDIIVDFFETPNISLDIHLKYLDIPSVMHNFLYNISWSSPVVIKGLRFLKLLIAKHLTPEMSLLVDTIKDSDIGNIGHMLFVKLSSSDWEIRQVVLSVVGVMAQTAKSFPSFREILTDASLPEIIATVCTSDKNPLIRAAAYKCLQDVSVVEGIEKNLRIDELTDKALEAIITEEDPLAKKEAIKFISVMYWNNKDNTDYKHTTKMYTYLEVVAFMDKNYLVQQEVISFWRKVTSKYMIDIGWADKTFPPVIFSKKIIQLTTEEIGRRIFNVLKELNETPCLNVIKQFCDSNDLCEEVSTVLDDWIDEFYSTYCKYQVTEELFRSHEGYTNISLGTTFFSSCTESYRNETEEMMRIINALIPGYENTGEYLGCLTSDLSLCEIPPLTVKAGISPSEFVRLVYNQVKTRKEPKHQVKDDEYILDY